MGHCWRSYSPADLATRSLIDYFSIYYLCYITNLIINTSDSKTRIGIYSVFIYLLVINYVLAFIVYFNIALIKTK